MRFARAMEPARPWVFLTPDRAYKLLRPVELPFVDHRDRPTRIDAVRAEFEVNRSFSPDVYLDLVDLHGADGDVEDRMIVMRRLDDADALTERRTPEDLDAALRSVARRIAGIHASLEALDGDDAAPASIAAVTRGCRWNRISASCGISPGAPVYSRMSAPRRFAPPVFR